MSYALWLDRRLQKVDLPSEGLLLSTKLAEVLGAARRHNYCRSPGRRATGPPGVTVPVIRLVDEWIGLSAYMDTRALNRLMREGETVSGAYLPLIRDLLRSSTR